MAGIAILFRVFIAGASVVIPERDQAIANSLEMFAVTHASLVATQLQQVLLGNKTYPNLKAVLVGGSAVSAPLRARAFEAGIPVFFSYGLSEMSSQVTTTAPAATANEIQTSGALLPYRSIKITSDGEILVKGATLFLGYVNTDGIIHPVDNEGWFSTGDLGLLDQQGWLNVLGRKDNMFISGGENIYPEQIEKAIQMHPEIRDVLVVPVKDPTFGMRPVAFIDADSFNQVVTNMDAFLNDKLARYMLPIKYFDWKDAPEKMGIKASRIEFSRQAEALRKRQ